MRRYPRALNLSEVTLKVHFHSIYEKLTTVN